MGMPLLSLGVQDGFELKLKDRGMVAIWKSARVVTGVKPLLTTHHLTILSTILSS